MDRKARTSKKTLYVVITLTNVHINYGAPQKVRENICGHIHIVSTRRKILLSKFSKIPTDFDLQNKTMI